MPPTRVTILTKAPRPGFVKTRLMPAIGADGAAMLHREMVRATVELVAASGIPFRVAIGGDRDGRFSGELHQAGVPIVTQPDGDLGARMGALLRGPGRQIAVGTDCVVFDPLWLREAAARPTPVTIGPSEDGGYWTIAVDGDGPVSLFAAVFEDIPWSTDRVLETTEDRCARAGYPSDRIATCYDVDEPPMLSRLAADPRCPASLRSLLSSLSPPLA